MAMAGSFSVHNVKSHSSKGKDRPLTQTPSGGRHKVYGYHDSIAKRYHFPWPLSHEPQILLAAAFREVGSRRTALATRPTDPTRGWKNLLFRRWFLPVTQPAPLVVLHSQSYGPAKVRSSVRGVGTPISLDKRDCRDASRSTLPQTPFRSPIETEQCVPDTLFCQRGRWWLRYRRRANRDKRS
ncbi:hypothetical protein SKAU_G00198800 [Synaphobranchus kaupii]|uniref:Uncharacterized protein n=1 Tax=Synaphobranchus kaupii TaxID=118154 RepID=A0A9Q1IXM6_SYNKA|nr:hypothetical protein SKAU_G00198800 [Synaphobranchus kaupii]